MLGINSIVPELHNQKATVKINLSREQQIHYVQQVQARAALLKQKTDFTLTEQRIILQGNRAFESLLCQFRHMIFSLIHRYSVSERYTFDELYEFGVIELERAVMRFDLSKGNSLSSVIFTFVRRKFFTLYRAILVEAKQNNKRVLNLIATTLIDERSPMTVVLEAEEKMVLALLCEGLRNSEDTRPKSQELALAA